MSDAQTAPEPRCPVCGSKVVLHDTHLADLPELAPFWGCVKWPACSGVLADDKEMGGLLRLDLDDLYAEGYYYTDFDVGGDGHSIVIEAKNRNAFLDEFARIWQEKAAEALEEWEREG